MPGPSKQDWSDVDREIAARKAASESLGGGAPSAPAVPRIYSHDELRQALVASADEAAALRAEVTALRAERDAARAEIAARDAAERASALMVQYVPPSPSAATTEDGEKRICGECFTFRRATFVLVNGECPNPQCARIAFCDICHEALPNDEAIREFGRHPACDRAAVEATARLIDPGVVSASPTEEEKQ